MARVVDGRQTRGIFMRAGRQKFNFPTNLVDPGKGDTPEALNFPRVIPLL